MRNTESGPDSSRDPGTPPSEPGHRERDPSVPQAWDVEQAQRLILALEGVIYARITELEEGGGVEHLHVVAASDVHDADIAQNVDAALKGRFGAGVDPHRVSVSQIAEGARAQELIHSDSDSPAPERCGRLRLAGFRTALQRDEHMVVEVRLTWQDREFTGVADGADVAPRELEVFATATLRAVESAVRAVARQDGDGPRLELSGVTMVEGLDVPSVLVYVTAHESSGAVTLAGAANVNGSRGQAVILATMQATDRWARGHLAEARN